MDSDDEGSSGDGSNGESSSSEGSGGEKSCGDGGGSKVENKSSRRIERGDQFVARRRGGLGWWRRN